MTKHHKRKPHPRPVMTKPEPIKVINENGEVIHEATLTPDEPLQAFVVVSKIWMHQKGVTPADIAEHAVLHGFWRLFRAKHVPCLDARALDRILNRTTE